MSKHVAWLLELQIKEGRGEDFQALMAEMASGTLASEPGTLDYEWSINAEGTVCHIFERYADAAAAMTHIGTFGEKYARRFLDVLQPTRLVIYGAPSAEVKAALAGLNPVVMQPAAGFSR